MKKIFLLTLLWLVAAPLLAYADNVDSADILASAHKAFDECRPLKGAYVIDDGHTVCLSGDIYPPMFLSLISNRDKIKDNVHVVISSWGGHINSSLDIIEILTPFHPTTVVGDACASACGQFLFLMGDRHVILRCGGVFIHGGPVPIETTLKSKDTDLNKQTGIEYTLRFYDFYKKRGINTDMLTKPPEDIQKRLDKGEIVFWQWTPNQMRAFGVKGLVTERDPDTINMGNDAECKASNTANTAPDRK
jgi:ATP-dependent protease ClpP protease subunit